MADFPYKDILHHAYPDMDVERDFPDKVLREAQFAPFAALTGHDAAVKETARLTQRRLELNEDIKAELDRKIRMLDDSRKDCQEVSVTYFRPDEKKAGGAYLVHVGMVIGVKDYERTLLFADGTEIPLDAIVNIEGDIFEKFPSFV